MLPCGQYYAVLLNRRPGAEFAPLRSSASDRFVAVTEIFFRPSADWRQRFRSGPLAT